MGTRQDDLDLWRSAEWRARRSQARKYQKWYEGTPLDETVNMRDRTTGDLIRKYPLDINIIKLCCDIHRDIARGIQQKSDPLVVRTSVTRRQDSDKAALIENTINDSVWVPSHGAAIQQEALLAMNIYGATAFKLSWEPWDPDLPLRIGVRAIKDPSFIVPFWDHMNPWRLIECYIGYEIPKRIAKTVYGIDVEEGLPGETVLRLEYWSPQEWWVRVDGKIPVMRWGDRQWKLAGDNELGVVPIYYIPHERTTNLLGDSEIPGQQELELDINSRLAGISDLARSANPGVLWGRDLNNKLDVRRIELGGQTLTYVVDVGNTRAGQRGAAPPQLDSLPMPVIPDSITEHPGVLFEFWQTVKRISPAVFGQDDTSSGRITGRAVGNRMFTSLAHAVTERINFSTVKTILDRDIIRMLALYKDKMQALDVDPPDIDVGDISMDIRQVWWPSAPMDAADRNAYWLSRLQQGGASIETFLEEQGVDDVETEREQIEAWTVFQQMAKRYPDALVQSYIENVEMPEPKVVEEKDEDEPPDNSDDRE